MQKLEAYKNLNLNTENDVFEYMIRNLKETIATASYFVDFEKAKRYVKDIEIELNLLDYLIGKENVQKELYTLITKYPNVVKTLPILIAKREHVIKVLVTDDNKIKDKIYSFLEKQRYTEQEKNEIVEFCDKSGLLDMFKSKQIKSVIDYVLGVEVGLDSNARKNRTGKLMEKLIETFIKELCEKHGYKYLIQANSHKIQKEFNIKVNVDKSDRQFDFVILKDNKLYVIETNFYTGGGSKLKSVAGEFRAVDSFMKTSNQDVTFMWITDGIGWNTAKRPLREAFNSIDHVLNIQLIEDGIFEQIIKE